MSVTGKKKCGEKETQVQLFKYNSVIHLNLKLGREVIFSSNFTILLTL